jgi:hypothetical protein
MDLSKIGVDAQNGFTGINIPGLTNVQNMLSTITTVSAVIGILFFIMYVISMVQRMRADRAMIAIRKDISAIHELLKGAVAPAPAAPVEPAVMPPTTRVEPETASPSAEHTN